MTGETRKDTPSPDIVHISVMDRITVRAVLSSTAPRVAASQNTRASGEAGACIPKNTNARIASGMERMKVGASRNAIDRENQ